MTGNSSVVLVDYSLKSTIVPVCLSIDVLSGNETSTALRWKFNGYALHND